MFEHEAYAVPPTKNNPYILTYFDMLKGGKTFTKSMAFKGFKFVVFYVWNIKGDSLMGYFNVYIYIYVSYLYIHIHTYHVKLTRYIHVSGVASDGLWATTKPHPVAAATVFPAKDPQLVKEVPSGELT